MQQLWHEAVFAVGIEPANLPLAIDDNEARAVRQAAVHAIQLESVDSEVVEGRLRAGEEEPASRVLLEMGRVFGEHWRRVVRRIDGDRYQQDIGDFRRRILQLA